MSFARKEPRPNPTEGFRFARPTRQEKTAKQLRPRQAAPGEPRKYSTLSRGKSMERKRMKRTLKTKQQLREAVFAPYERWLTADGALCVVCGTPKNIQGAHVGVGGMGIRNGTAADKIRLCGPRLGDIGCHARFDQTIRPWTKMNKAEFSRHQRLVHWEAFRAFAGVALSSNCVGVAGDLLEWLACDIAIAESAAELRATERSA